MSEVLVITGACGVGKTTVAKAWATKKQGVAIDTDYFTEWVYNDDFERFTQSEEKLVANLSFVTATEYLKQNMPVAIEGVWSPYGLNILRNRFEKEAKSVYLKFIWLHCEIKENHRRDALRKVENQMKQRVDIVNQELRGYHWANYIHPIDSTQLRVTDTVNLIENIGYLAPG